ncbi:hypothetical protein EV653_1565 [Kribbella pratensis]|uniref:Uncharacterized protein n=2 Tax=Kribbella pratensis TaxID=2512112 RepID=A0A4R8CJJ3_9ACTN|nr:hypothetical protein EV653_1565 [Kribbella pratensis]
MPADNEVVAYGPPEWTVTPLIHGRTRDWKDVTVFEANGANYAGPVPGETRESYRVTLALIGCHAPADDFSGAMIEFDQLNSWSDAPSIIINPSSNEPDESQITNRIAASVRLEPLTLAHANINGDSLRLETGVQGSRSSQSIHFDQFSAFAIEMGQPANARTIVDTRVRPLQDLLIFSLGRSVQLTSLMLRPALENGRYCDAYLNAIQPTDDAKPTSRNSPWSYSEPSLLSVRWCPLPIDDLLRQWFELWSDLRETFVLLHAPHYAPFMYTENRFASIFQSAEAFHKRRFDSRELDPATHKKRVQDVIAAIDSSGGSQEISDWARRVLQAANYKPLWLRIDELVKSTGAVGDAILDAAPTFARAAANARTGVAHGGSSSSERPDSVARYWHGVVLSWVLRACLLLQLGVPLAEVVERVLQKAPFQHAVEQIRIAQRE